MSSILRLKNRAYATIIVLKINLSFFLQWFWFFDTPNRVIWGVTVTRERICNWVHQVVPHYDCFSVRATGLWQERGSNPPTTTRTEERYNLLSMLLYLFTLILFTSLLCLRNFNLHLKRDNSLFANGFTFDDVPGFSPSSMYEGYLHGKSCPSSFVVFFFHTQLFMPLIYDYAYQKHV